jgi:hypothetical protein
MLKKLFWFLISCFCVCFCIDCLKSKLDSSFENEDAAEASNEEKEREFRENTKHFYSKRHYIRLQNRGEHF